MIYFTLFANGLPRKNWQVVKLKSGISFPLEWGESTVEIMLTAYFPFIKSVWQKGCWSFAPPQKGNPFLRGRHINLYWGNMLVTAISWLVKSESRTFHWASNVCFHLGFAKEEEQSLANDIAGCLLRSFGCCEDQPSALSDWEHLELLVVEGDVLPACQMGNQIGAFSSPGMCETFLVTSSCSYSF